METWRDGRITKRAVKGRCVIGLFARVIRGRNVSIEVKRGLRSCILLPRFTYGLETLTRNSAQQLRVRIVEMSYLGGRCYVTGCMYV